MIKDEAFWIADVRNSSEFVSDNIPGSYQNTTGQLECLPCPMGFESK